MQRYKVKKPCLVKLLHRSLYFVYSRNLSFPTSIGCGVAQQEAEQKEQRPGGGDGYGRQAGDKGTKPGEKKEAGGLSAFLLPATGTG